MTFVICLGQISAFTRLAGPDCSPAYEEPCSVQPNSIRRYRAFLFDMDGTLLNSIVQWSACGHLGCTAWLGCVEAFRAIDTPLITRQALPVSGRSPMITELS